MGGEARRESGGRPRRRSEILPDLRGRAAASDSPRRRRRFVRFVLLSVSGQSGGAWPWVVVAMLGAYHGVDPSMGWLFAVALGLQDHSRARVMWALLPIAIGHLLSIAAVVALVGGLRMTSFNPEYIRYGGAAILIGFGIFRLLRPHAHPRWVAMRVNSAELGLWSFLMASAHGAGLMLFPILMNIMPECGAWLPNHHRLPQLGQSLGTGALVTIVHTLGMLV